MTLLLPFRRLLRSTLAALVLAGAGCNLLSFDEPDAVVPELPTIVPVEVPATHEWHVRTIDEPFVLEVELRLANGALATDYAFTWSTPADSVSGTTAFTNRITVTRERPSPGRERLVIRGHAPEMLPGVGCRVEVLDPEFGFPVGQPNTLGPFNVRFHGTEPASIVLPPAKTVLGVGERRPFDAYALGADSVAAVGGRMSHLPVTLESAQPDVVAVEADGRTLRGVAAGTTTLTVRSGTISRTTQVTVDERPLGAPTPETLRTGEAGDGAEIFPILTHLPGAVRGDDLVALDGRGWPFFSAVVDHRLFGAQWTGTGLGWVRVSPPGRDVDEPGASTFDERGVLYVAYRTLGLQIAIAERRQDAAPGDFTYRPLFPLAAFGDSRERLTFSSRGHVSVQPRRGGGAWVLVPLEFAPESGDGCRMETRVFEVTDDGIVSRTVSTASSVGECEPRSLSARWAASTVLYGQRPGATLPDVFVAAGEDFLQSGLHHAGADGWTRISATVLTKAARGLDPLAPGAVIVLTEESRAMLPEGLASVVRFDTTATDSPRFHAASNWLLAGDNAVPVPTGRLVAPGRAVALKLIDDRLLDVANPLEFVTLPE